MTLSLKKIFLFSFALLILAFAVKVVAVDVTVGPDTPYATNFIVCDLVNDETKECWITSTLVGGSQGSKASTAARIWHWQNDIRNKDWDVQNIYLTGSSSKYDFYLNGTDLDFGYANLTLRFKNVNLTQAKLLGASCSGHRGMLRIAAVETIYVDNKSVISNQCGDVILEAPNIIIEGNLSTAFAADIGGKGNSLILKKFVQLSVANTSYLTSSGSMQLLSDKPAAEGEGITLKPAKIEAATSTWLSRNCCWGESCSDYEKMGLVIEAPNQNLKINSPTVLVSNCHAAITSRALELIPPTTCQWYSTESTPSGCGFNPTSFFLVRPTISYLSISQGSFFASAQNITIGEYVYSKLFQDYRADKLFKLNETGLLHSSTSWVRVISNSTTENFVDGPILAYNQRPDLPYASDFVQPDFLDAILLYFPTSKLTVNNSILSRRGYDAGNVGYSISDSNISTAQSELNKWNYTAPSSLVDNETPSWKTQANSLFFEGRAMPPIDNLNVYSKSLGASGLYVNISEVGPVYGKELPDNSVNGWTDMRQNLLLLHMNDEYAFNGFALKESAGAGKTATLKTDDLNINKAGASGQLNGALYFDGNDDYVQTNIKKTQFPTGFTAMAWVKADNFTGEDCRIIFDVNDFWLCLDNGNLTGYGGSPRTISSQSLNDSLWHHVAITRNSTNGVKVYFDGVKALDYFDSHTLNDYNVTIGSLFSGWMDEVAIFSNDLSADAIKAIYLEQSKSTVALQAKFSTNVFKATTGAQGATLDNINKVAGITVNGVSYNLSNATTATIACSSGNYCNFTGFVGNDAAATGLLPSFAKGNYYSYSPFFKLTESDVLETPTYSFKPANPQKIGMALYNRSSFIDFSLTGEVELTSDSPGKLFNEVGFFFRANQTSGKTLFVGLQPSGNNVTIYLQYCTNLDVPTHYMHCDAPATAWIKNFSAFGFDPQNTVSNQLVPLIDGVAVKKLYVRIEAAGSSIRIFANSVPGVFGDPLISTSVTGDANLRSGLIGFYSDQSTATFAFKELKTKPSSYARADIAINAEELVLGQNADVRSDYILQTTTQKPYTVGSTYGGSVVLWGRKVEMVSNAATGCATFDGSKKACDVFNRPGSCRPYVFTNPCLPTTPTADAKAFFYRMACNLVQPFDDNNTNYYSIAPTKYSSAFCQEGGKATLFGLVSDENGVPLKQGSMMIESIKDEGGKLVYAQALTDGSLSPTSPWQAFYNTTPIVDGQVAVLMGAGQTLNPTLYLYGAARYYVTLWISDCPNDFSPPFNFKSSSSSCGRHSYTLPLSTIETEKAGLD